MSYPLVHRLLPRPSSWDISGADLIRCLAPNVACHFPLLAFRFPRATSLHHPLFQGCQCPRGETFSLFALVPNVRRQLIDETEVRIHRLEVPRISLAQVAVEGAEHRFRLGNARQLSQKD